MHLRSCSVVASSMHSFAVPRWCRVLGPSAAAHPVRELTVSAPLHLRPVRRTQSLHEAVATAEARSRELYETNARLEAHVQARSLMPCFLRPASLHSGLNMIMT